MSYPVLRSDIVNDELRDHFMITTDDKKLLRKARGDAHRLALAVLLKAYQHLGYAPRKKDIPPAIVEWIADQLGTRATLVRSSRTWSHHHGLVRDHLGVRQLGHDDECALIEHLVRCAPTTPTLKKLLEHAVDWCRGHKVELPTEGALRRLTASARRQFFERLYDEVSSRLDDVTCQRMASCLVERKDKGGDATVFDWMKSSPGRVGLKTILDEVAKLRLIRTFSIESSSTMLSDEVRKLLRDRARAEDASRMRRHPRAVRLTLLVALLASRGAEVTDNVVRVLLELIKKMERKADKAVELQLVRNAPKVWGKSQLLYRVALAVKANPDGCVRDVVFPIVGEEVIERLVEEATAEDYDEAKYRIVQRKYRGHYRKMMKPVLDALVFHSDNPAHKPLLRGLSLVQRHLASKHTYYPEDADVPEELLTGRWRSLVIDESGGNTRYTKHPFEICVLRKLDKAIRCKEVWVEGAYRYRNPAEDLPADWEDLREEHYVRCGIPLDGHSFLDGIRVEMQEALGAFDSHLAAGDGEVTVRRPGGGERGVFHVPPLPRRDERPILDEIKSSVVRRWGVLDLLDILVEADRHAKFTQHFETSGQRQILRDDAIRSRLLLVLFSLGTNLGLRRIHAATQPGCSYDDLRYFRSRYVTTGAVRKANIDLVNRILDVRSRRVWGEGTSCASDGKHLGAWDHNLTAKYSPHYGSTGVMAYWHVETNATCIYSKLRPPLSSEVAAMVEGLIRHDTEMRVERNFVDSHGQSEVAFAFARFLGFDLLPRLKRVKHERLYLPDKGTRDCYPHLAGVFAANPIRWQLIEEQYDEMVRHVVAVKDRTAPIDSILRRFSRYNRTHPTYKALTQLGKALKTTFLCRYLSSLDLRQEVHEGLNTVESWNAVTDFIFYGRKSEVSTNDPEQQELGILCLQLLQNAVILTNTVMIERVLHEEGLLGRMDDEDLRALTPLFTANVNPYGDFTLDLDKPSFLEAA